MATRILVIIQARQGSSRLPGKTLANLAGRPMLAHVVERAAAIPGIDDLVLAIADGPANEAIVHFARAAGLRWERGSEPNVLERTYRTVCKFPADAIVRISPDCPLLDPVVSGRVVATYRSLEDRVAYVSNVQPPTFPDGLDTEVFSREALEAAHREVTSRSDREHVTQFIIHNPERFPRQNVVHTRDLSKDRWTVDTSADLEFVRAIYAALGPRIFGMQDVLNLLEARPELRSINAGQTRNEGLARSLAADAAAGTGAW
jgi:spore coat polysaccharide biosynthesis protein SpsF (cytidylyltransferase family)